MIIREVYPEEKDQFNKAALHPLQSWEWGEFRKKTGLDVVRLGVFENKQIKKAVQFTIHPIPKINVNIGYVPKCILPDKSIIEALKKLGEKYNCIFLKLEPNIGQPINNPDEKYQKIKKFLLENNALPGRPLFTQYTFQIDLTKSEKELIDQMKPKTKYNIRLAIKKGVVVQEDNSDESFEEYIKLMKETTKRQKFYAHDERYHRFMWETLKPTGIAHLLRATWEGKTLTSWIVFVFNNILYYPYGASSRENRELMASNLMMWEAIRFGKKTNCKIFDLWGCLGPNPDEKDPWYGFHHFKEGYGPTMIKFIGTFDLILDPTKYKLYIFADKLRWKWLNFKASLPFLS